MATNPIENYLGTQLKAWVDFIVQGTAPIIGLVFAYIDLVRQAGQIEATQAIQEFWAQDPQLALTPTQAADMVLRGVMSQADGAGEAALSGINKDRFDLMVLDTGEPPPIMEMLSLWRRGLISESLLDQMIRYSRVRTDYTPQVKLLRYATMSGADAIEARVKNVITDAEARDLFDKAGGMADQFDTLLNAAGNAIGIEQVLSLWMHGYATKEDVQQVIYHSRVNPTFEPLAAEMWHHYLGVYQVEKILKAGGCTPEQATKWMTELGYPSDQVASFVATGAGTTVVKHKEITESQTVDLYLAKYITQAQAETLLGDLGYPADQRQFILEVASARHALTQLNKALTAVQKAYVAGHISDSQALSDLAKLEVPSEAAGQYIADWKIDKQLQFKTLTMSEVGDIYKKGGMTLDQAKTRWLAMGYPSADVELLAFNYGGPTPAGSPAASAGG